MARRTKTSSVSDASEIALERESIVEPEPTSDDPEDYRLEGDSGQGAQAQDIADLITNTDGDAEWPYIHPSVVIDGQELFRYQGDILADIDEIQILDALDQATQSQQNTYRIAAASGFGSSPVSHLGNTSGLIGMVQDGKLVRWSPGTVLSYCVLRNTFPREEWYQEVADNMWLAVNEWADTCGVEFQYVEGADNSDSLRPPEVLFPVRHISAGGVFIAAAFFPTDPPNRRRILVDPSYHTTTYNRVGVFVHELGHVLGFRHEQVSSSAPAVCPDEDPTGTIDLTAYDPRSVMHYFCGGAGTRDLAITQLDRAGSQLVYGPPLSNFQLQEA